MKYLIILVSFVMSVLPLHGLAQESSGRLTFEMATERSLHYGRIVDRMPEETWAVIDDQEDLDNWIAEIVPFFGYEAITGPDYDEHGLVGYVYPDKATFSFFDEQGSQGQHHILGMANCISGDMWMNARFANPVSSRFQSRDTLAVLVHELAHIQGICFDPDMSEISAQLSTLEVLSAMAIKGSDMAFSSLMLELESMYGDAALALSLQEGRLAEFEYIFGFDGNIDGNALRAASWDKTMRYWEADQEKLTQILTDYNLAPVVLFTIGLAQDSCRFTNIEWNTEKKEIEYLTHELDGIDCINGVQLPINQSIFTFPLIIDDLSYVVDHDNEMADEIIENAKGESKV